MPDKNHPGGRLTARIVDFLQQYAKNFIEKTIAQKKYLWYNEATGKPEPLM